MMTEIAQQTNSQPAHAIAFAIPHILEHIIRQADFDGLPACATVHSTWFKATAPRLYGAQAITKDRNAYPVLPWALRHRVAVHRGHDQGKELVKDDPTDKVAWAVGIALKNVQRIHIQDHDHWACHHRYSRSKTAMSATSADTTDVTRHKVDTIELEAYLASDNYCALFHHFPSRRLIIRQHPLPDFDYQNTSDIPAIAPVADIVLLLIDAACMVRSGSITMAATGFPDGTPVIVRSPSWQASKAAATDDFVAEDGITRTLVARACARLFNRGQDAKYIVINAETYDKFRQPTVDQSSDGTLGSFRLQIGSDCQRYRRPGDPRDWYKRVDDVYMTIAEFKASAYAKEAEDIEDF